MVDVHAPVSGHAAATPALLRRAAVAGLFVVAYLALDRLDSLSSLPVAGVAWDLAGGLAFALLAREGLWLAPIVAGAEILSGRLWPTSAGALANAADAVVMAAAYAAAASVLRRRGAGRLTRQAHLLQFSLAAACAALARAGGQAAVAMAAGGAAPSFGDTASGFLALLVGIVVSAPLVLAFERPRFAGVGSLVEMAGQAVALVATLALVLPPDPTDQFRYFYLLFLPQIWIAMRHGLGGAAFGNVVVQLGLVLFLASRPADAALAYNYQVRLLALGASMLFLGAAVTERRAVEAALRERQDALARVGRLSLAGEMAAALAHELSQPLVATAAFVRAAQALMDKGAPAKANEALESAAAQADRAGGIVASLRRFVGRSPPRPTLQSFEDLARDVVVLVEPQSARCGVRIVRAVDRDLPDLQVDPVQAQQVLVNLVQNAIDAMREADSARRLITLAARSTGDFVEIEVRDTGPGVRPDLVDGLFEAFVSGKPSGMGLGLAISRGIVERYGGKLWLAENEPGRCALRFTLPAAGRAP
ncbi:MAG TPA: ATP-binding protein [Caulobacteraceae bacterium]|nr:ATP-binding protein [Caulobacteraceae bacterium]